MVGRPNNTKKWKKGTETYDIRCDMERRIEKELMLLGYEDDMNCLTHDIEITIEINSIRNSKREGKKQ